MFPKINLQDRHTKTILGAIIFIAVILAFFARGGTTSVDKHSKNLLSCDPGQWSTSVYYSDNKDGCPDLIEFYLLPSFVNEAASELVTRVVTAPSGLYGVAERNSGFTNRAFTVDLDSVDAARTLNTSSNATIGINSRSKMSTKNALFYYPFDFYVGEITLQATDFQTKSTIPSTVSVGVQSLSGWQLKFSQSGEPEPESRDKIIYGDGLAKISWELKRANVIFIAIILLIFLMMIALVSGFAITRSISSGNRPPSMNLLLWLATILFAIIQVRGNFPGGPPLGILIDYLIVFPVLSLLLLLGIANTFFWLARADWDIENEKAV
ncbi:DUF4436 domain-containing protein [Candidatus Nanopelagicus hibericus]|uniref:DUF4436 domain-containing protein n=1 Tax=Candidatus Nanopelagicus hibericus TaxID=1884915 RepID=A0A249K8J4_9ACTN|nr:DUF4436 family protein [Candidatus Nanopelagicus hibericus]ASY13117.1 DUF4436 domain-containing protein [Candidatus Nanopelagicus hibericus]